MLFLEHNKNRTFIGIAVHNATASGNAEVEMTDLAAGIRQDANGLLGTTLQLSELVSIFVPSLIMPSGSRGMMLMNEFI